jgi:hypothetical protein
MIDPLVKRTALLCGLSLIAGCSYFSGHVNVGSDRGKSSASQERQSYVRVWLDDNQATPGRVRCEIAQPISLGPKLRYEITEPEKLGRVTNVTINIFHEFNGGWSNNVDFIVIASDTNNPDAQMKPGVDYHLGSPGGDIRIMDGNGNTLDRVALESGTKYLMNFVVRADRSETVGVEFTAR